MARNPKSGKIRGNVTEKPVEMHPNQRAKRVSRGMHIIIVITLVMANRGSFVEFLYPHDSSDSHVRSRDRPANLESKDHQDFGPAGPSVIPTVIT